MHTNGGSDGEARREECSARRDKEMESKLEDIEASQRKTDEENIEGSEEQRKERRKLKARWTKKNKKRKNLCRKEIIEKKYKGSQHAKELRRERQKKARVEMD